MESDTIPPLYFCEVGRCGKVYLSQQEADLCTPAEQIPHRYPGTVAERQVTSQ